MKRIFLLPFLTVCFISADCFKFDRPVTAVEASLLALDSIYGNYWIRITKVLPTKQGAAIPEPYFVSNAKVIVTAPDGTAYPFLYNEIEDDKTAYRKFYGTYTAKPFRLLNKGEYKLTIEHEGSIYTSTAEMSVKPTIIRQSVKLSSSSTSTTYTATLVFRDIEGEDDYYFGVLKYRTRWSLSDSIYRSPTFSNSVQIQDGREFPIAFLHRPVLLQKDTLWLHLVHVSSQRGKIEASFSTLGSNPFQPPPAFPRTNIKNITNPDTRCIGYFSIDNFSTVYYVRE
ncbi:hypothetical protein CHS0354_023881 [Potamilus streckersoni]|uniref:DUF4249 domain-containing protein n=1 Tax=Potamilus streckersoni TaxID=2493646 RepID=A0AAE0RZA0_9BIVA|nr:hypothetical protein CHS0354_023881 [Potamilus streckersoni]